jgi:hypothetical protein
MRSFFAAVCLVALPVIVRAQAPAAGYPVKPEPLADSVEIALALSAAPAELSKVATVYTVKDGKTITLRAGTSGSACIVVRDFHGGSLYPICFNPEGARTVLKREIMQVQMRSLGVPEDSIDRAVAAAYKRGDLEMPRDLALAYMMSPRQVLFSASAKEGRRVGAWHPHLMFYVPGATPAKVGLSDGTGNGPIGFSGAGTPNAELIVKVPQWSDGSPVKTP